MPHADGDWWGRPSGAPHGRESRDFHVGQLWQTTSAPSVAGPVASLGLAQVGCRAAPRDGFKGQGQGSGGALDVDTLEDLERVRRLLGA